MAATGWDDDENNWWMKLAAYTYLPDGEVGQTDFGNGIRTGYGYDGRGMIQVVDHYRPGVQDISWRQYWRDSRDRITAFQKSYNPGSNPMENGRGDRFAYDDEGELTDGWYNALDPAGNFNSWTRKDHFDYDALGNRQGGSCNLASRSAGTTAVSFTRRDNGLNEYSHWWPAGTDYGIYYDDNFNQDWQYPGNGVTMADGWIVASYNALNQPIVIGSFAYYPTGTWLWFGYDPLGRCVKRWVSDSGDVYSNPATYYHYDGWNLLQEGNNAWGPARVYAHGTRVDEIVWSYNTFTGEQAFHHYDARGHCTLLTDSTGNILEQYEYDAFGQPYFFDASGNAIGSYDLFNQWQGYSLFGNRFLFTGREWLSDVRLYDYRNRMYQPELGRFMQPDPNEFAAGDYNLYRYCHNDPVNHLDPFGLAPVRVADDVDNEARAAGVIVNAITQKDEPGFRLEAGKSIFRNGDGTVSTSRETVRSGPDQRIYAFPKPETPNQQTKADVHSHVIESQDRKTGANTSAGDVKRGDVTGRPIYTNAPDGRGGVIQERYRPSDAQSVKERQKEGGVIERYRDQRWERIGK